MLSFKPYFPKSERKPREGLNSLKVDKYYDEYKNASETTRIAKIERLWHKKAK